MSNDCPHGIDVKVAVVEQRQIDLERRQDQFMVEIRADIAEINTNMKRVWDEVNSIHGHITRCRNELREEIDRDFMTKAEGERMRGDIKAINTKIYMTGAGIVLALSIVQIAVAVWS